MNKFKKSYYNNKWYAFANQIKGRDNFTCLKCGRNESDVILQVHHNIYNDGLKPWEYPMSDCLTLCKGCHSREHNLVEPCSGWELISIDDLGSLSGICERRGCGNEIRYEHLIYHPQSGYKTVGSSCVEYLTNEDQYLSKQVVKLFKKISDFVSKSTWNEGFTKAGHEFIFKIISSDTIRIYSNYNKHSFQIILKNNSNYKKNIINTVNKNLEQVKELAYIVFMGLKTDDEKMKNILRDIYKSSR